jgi:hypothetical protein
MWRLIALAVTAGTGLGYLALMRVAPGTFGWTYPRGGMVILMFSLLAANAAIWVAVRADLTLARKFELCAAAWIWLLVQAGGMAWMYVSFR